MFADTTGRAISRAAVAAFLLIAMQVVNPVLADNVDGYQVEDPHYGEVLFQFYQQDYFTALTHLAAYRSQERVNNHAAEAELLQGGLLLSWGQHQEAGDIFERLLADNSDPYTRDRAWFYLGKVLYQRGYLQDAENAFESVRNPLPAELEAERFNLLARIYMDQGRFAEAAELLSTWKGGDIWATYSRFNLGVAMVRLGELEAGAVLLNEVGTMRINGPYREELLGLRDKANLALGFAYLQSDLEGDAKPVLQRVRLNGPFSNKALLGAGWADMASADYRSALGPWLELSKRGQLDSAVQESLLAVPFAFAKLDAEPQAAEYYSRALQIFDAEIRSIDSAVVEAGEGRLINTLLEDDEAGMGGWFWQLDAMPDQDNTRYLYFTIADHQFHESLKSYRDLMALHKHLQEWQERLSTYREMRAVREQAYAIRLPVLEARIEEIDLDGLRESYELLQAHSLMVNESHDVVSLATAQEQEQWQQLASMEASPAWNQPNSAAQREKHRVLKGLLLWKMEREFQLRAWRQQRTLDELAEQINFAEQYMADIDAAKVTMVATIVGFDERIDELDIRMSSLQGQLQAGMQNYADLLQGIAQGELLNQRQRLLTYRAQARFALASIYDRMSVRNE